MEIEKLIVKYLVGCLSKEEDQILKKCKGGKTKRVNMWSA